MAFGRRRSSFALGAPKVLTFVISLVLAVLAIGSAFVHLPHDLAIVTTHRFWLLAAAWGLLVLGVLLPGV